MTAITVDELRAVLTKVRDQFGFAYARAVIRRIGGGAGRISEIPAHLYDAVFHHADELVNGRQRVIDGLTGAAGQLSEAAIALISFRELYMTAMDDLTGAVNNAVAEMGKAAQFIKDHPAAQNDSALADFATRLQAASDALAGVDVTAAVADTGAGSAGGGTDTGTGGAPA